MDDNNFLAYLQGRGQLFNPYAGGNKVYGSGNSAPNVGPVADKSGYQNRDVTARRQRNAMLQRLQARQSGNYMSPANLSSNWYGA